MPKKRKTIKPQTEELNPVKYVRLPEGYAARLVAAQKKLKADPTQLGEVPLNSIMVKAIGKYLDELGV